MSRHSFSARPNGVNNGPVKLTIDQAMRALRVALAANVPAVLWGPPGSGKTSAAQQLAHKLNFDFEVLIGSVLEPSDLLGVPVPTDGPTVQYKASPLVPFGFPDADSVIADLPRPKIWMLDEVDRAELSVQNAYLRLVNDRELNGFKLPDNVLVLMAGNGSSDVGTTPLSEAFATRMVHLYIDTNSDKALEGWCQYAGTRPDVRPEEIYFARQKRNEYTRPNEVEEHAVFNDRSYLDIACPLDRMCAQLNVSHEVRFALLAGSIGRDKALEMIASFDLFQKAPRVEEIVADPHNVMVPTDVGVIYALSQSLVSYAVSQSNRECAEAILKYGARFNEEQRNLLYRQLGDRCPQAVVSPLFINWMQTN